MSAYKGGIQKFLSGENKGIQVSLAKATGVIKVPHITTLIAGAFSVLVLTTTPDWSRDVVSVLVGWGQKQESLPMGSGLIIYISEVGISTSPLGLMLCMVQYAVLT